MKKAELEALKSFLEREKSNFGYIENIFAERMMIRPANDFTAMITGYELVAAADMKESEFTQLKELLKEWIKRGKQSKFNNLSSGLILFPVSIYNELNQKIEEFYLSHKEDDDG